MTVPNNNKVYDSELMRALRRKHEHLNPALKKVSAFLQAHPYRSAGMNIEQLAAATFTSTAAVNRLANALELNGFTGLRLALMENLMSFASAADAIGERFRQVPDSHFTLADQLELSKSHLENVSRMNEPDTILAMARHLLEARSVFVVGFGSSFHLAGMAVSQLAPFCASVHCVAMDAGMEGAAYRLSGITRHDVLLAIAMPTYTRDTIRLAQFAKSRDACVISLTDCPASPLAELSRLSLFVPPTHPVLPHSRVALTAMIEALFAEVCQQAPDRAARPASADVLACARSDPRSIPFDQAWPDVRDTFPGEGQ